MPFQRLDNINAASLKKVSVCVSQTRLAAKSFVVPYVVTQTVSLRGLNGIQLNRKLRVRYEAKPTTTESLDAWTQSRKQSQQSLFVTSLFETGERIRGNDFVASRRFDNLYPEKTMRNLLVVPKDL